MVDPLRETEGKARNSQRVIGARRIRSQCLYATVACPTVNPCCVAGRSERPELRRKASLEQACRSSKLDILVGTFNDAVVFGKCRVEKPRGKSSLHDKHFCIREPRRCTRA